MAPVLLTGAAALAAATASLSAPLVVLLDLVRINAPPARVVVLRVEIVRLDRLRGLLTILVLVSHMWPLCSFADEMMNLVAHVRRYQNPGRLRRVRRMAEDLHFAPEDRAGSGPGSRQEDPMRRNLWYWIGTAAAVAGIAALASWWAKNRRPPAID